MSRKIASGYECVHSAKSSKRQPGRLGHDESCKEREDCSSDRGRAGNPKFKSRYGWKIVSKDGNKKKSMKKTEEKDKKSPASVPSILNIGPQKLDSFEEPAVPAPLLSFDSILNGTKNIINLAHENVERLFLQAALGVQNLPPGTDEAITLNYRDFSNCSSRSLTPPSLHLNPSLPPKSPKTSNAPKPTKTPYSSPSYSSERMTPRILESGTLKSSSPCETPTDSFLLKPPPNTPNFDVVFKPLSDTKSDGSLRETNAKTAAMCILQGLGLVGSTMRHRSPVSSMRIKAHGMMGEDSTNEDIVPVKDARLASFPKAYRVCLNDDKACQNKNNASSNNSGQKIEAPKTCAPSMIAARTTENGLDIVVKLILTVGKYKTKPVQLKFREGVDRPAELLIDGQSVWTGEKNGGFLAEKKDT
ncbi:unnamed protein product [Bursaphelenchus xylophilus]|uniref:(pine wood nematode) hypothetical protein n=1 Tax=Bursaphelenchus xylophilus TaxID=6326 RepID=A0A1I7S4J2_BURXY|nr:unnamed protein product [Bursaphelenchus xylophilus]CAG9117162.1 unnamed protein product [Bursaphelenchus xylophilus]